MLFSSCYEVLKDVKLGNLLIVFFDGYAVSDRWYSIVRMDRCSMGITTSHVNELVFRVI